MNTELAVPQPDGARLRVSAADVDVEAAVAEMVVDAHTGGGVPESWRLRIPLDPVEVAGLADHRPTLAVVLAALVAEWWTVRHYEPEAARLGERL